MVNERREEYYQGIGEKKAQKLRAKRLQQLLEKMGRDRVSPEDLILKWSIGLQFAIRFIRSRTEERKRTAMSGCLSTNELGIPI